MADFDEDAVQEAIIRLQPQLNDIIIKLSALTTRIEAVELNSSMVEIPIPETIEIKTMPDGNIITYRKE